MQAAFAAALEPRLRDIHSYFRRLGVDAASAEDLAQDTFVIAWQSLSGLRDERKLRSWLYGIAYRRYLRHRGSASSRATAELADETADGGQADPGSDERLAAAMLRRALRGLPEIYRHPLALIYWEDLSYREAAAVLSLSIGTLAWRVHKALKLLRQALAEKGAEDDGPLRCPQRTRRADPVGED